METFHYAVARTHSVIVTNRHVCVEFRAVMDAAHAHMFAWEVQMEAGRAWCAAQFGKVEAERGSCCTIAIKQYH